MTLRVELEPYEERGGEPCSGCGGPTVVVGGFAHEDGDASGVYRAAWCTRDDHPSVKVVVAVGEFWRDDAVADAAVALDIWPTETTFRMQFTDEPESPWSSGGHLGRILTREEALKSPHKERVLHIAEHVCIEDARVNQKLMAT